jgi:hypothetical protein
MRGGVGIESSLAIWWAELPIIWVVVSKSWSSDVHPHIGEWMRKVVRGVKMFRV